MLELEELRFTSKITDLEKRLVVAKGQGLGRGLEQEVRVSRCKVSYTE